MSLYRFCTLYSGSGGNAAYLETAGARILIDAGRSAKALQTALTSIGVPVDSLDAIFITHEHNDHVSALEVLTKRHAIPIHMLYECALRYQRTQPEALCACLHLYKKPEDISVKIGNVQVTAFPTPHDSRASVGYRFDISTEQGILSVALATDMGYVTAAVEKQLSGCESVVIESNHDIQMLMEGPYPYELKQRIRSRWGHLSNLDCADLAAALAEQGTRHFLLAHLSEENNRPEIAYDETVSVLAGLEADVRVADPLRVTMLMGEADAPVPKQDTSMPVPPPETAALAAAASAGEGYQP